MTPLSGIQYRLSAADYTATIASVGSSLRELTDRLISISATQLAAVHTVLAIAGGPSKRHAIAAALASGIINALVTDINTAHYLLQRRPTSE